MHAPFFDINKEQLRTIPEAEQIVEMISVIRNIRGENNIKPNVKIDILVATKDDSLVKNMSTFEEIVFALAGVKSVAVQEQVEKREGLAGGVGKAFEVFIDLSGTIDTEQETKRLDKEKKKLLAKQEQISRKLSNEEFLSKAPEKVIEKNRAELDEINMKISKIDENLETIKAMGK